MIENKVFNLCARPEEWFSVAERLERAAQTLRDHLPRSENIEDEMLDRSQESMLWGFCLENSFKGILEHQKNLEGGSIVGENKKGLSNYEGPGHDLNKLAKEIGFEVNLDAELALKFYTQSMLHFGRYPIPKNSLKQAIYWQDNFDDVLSNIFARLREEIKTIRGQ
jgi:hypothetical protein